MYEKAEDGYRICSLNATMSGMNGRRDTERETGNEVQSGYGTRNRDGRREWQNMVCPMQNRGGGLKRENKKPAQQQNRQGTVPGGRRDCCRALR